MKFRLTLPANMKQLPSMEPQQWSVIAQQAPFIISIAATLGIAWQAAQLTWLLLNNTHRPVSPAVSSAQPTPPSVTDNFVDIPLIVRTHLFGLVALDTQPDTSNLPETQMNLVLAGTIAFEDPATGYAIVGESAANAKFYPAGAFINGSIRLHSVYPDRIILERNGKLESLLLPRLTANTSNTNTKANTSPPVSAVGAQLGKNLRNLARNNPAAISEMLRAQPVFAGGKQRGYRIYPGRDRQQFANLGLQPGDLVTAVNGMPLDDPNRGNDILNTLSSSSTVTVTIERNGTTQQLALDAAQFSMPSTGTLPNVGDPNINDPATMYQ